MLHKNTLVTRDDFFDEMRRQRRALTYNDLRMITRFSEVSPTGGDVHSWFSRHVRLNIPIVSAAMDYVTEYKMAIAMAKAGGLGIIHRNLLPQVQAEHVRRVKVYLNGKVAKPICVREDLTIAEVLSLKTKEEHGFSSFPVVNSEGKIVGLITKRDFEFCTNSELYVREVMTPVADLVIAPSGTSLDEAYKMLHHNKKRILLLLDDDRSLNGMYVWSDVTRVVQDTSSIFNVDENGHLRVGAAIGAGEGEIERSELLVEAGCDVLVLDSAHGDSQPIYAMITRLKKYFPSVDVVAGNVSQGESAKRLADAGVDGIKNGQGPGAICSTRIQAGIGLPQASSVAECSRAIRGMDIPLCADGGIQHPGDVALAIGLGADSVMLGSLLAGTTETPGKIHDTLKGRFKLYRGMGSLSAMRESAASRQRYGQGSDIKKVVPEGVEGLVPYKGDVSTVLDLLVGGLKISMGYQGAATMEILQTIADFNAMSEAGFKESAPHDIVTIDPDDIDRWR